MTISVTDCKDATAQEYRIRDEALAPETSIGSSDLSENTHQMMNRPTNTSDGPTVEYCGRCGKLKKDINDYWVHPRGPVCTCPPIEQWSSGQFKRQGWECPKCKRVYAPHVEECEHCRPPDESLVVTTTLHDGRIKTRYTVPMSDGVEFKTAEDRPGKIGVVFSKK